MKYQPLPGTQDQASVIVLGTAWYGTTIAEDDAFAMMDAYVEHGGNVLDTASMYANWVDGGDGKSEQTLGKWLKARQPKDVLVATKGADQCMDRATIRRQLSRSLELLQLDSVDYYWLHRDDRDVPVADILGWMNECVDEGLFKAFGCSNWKVDRIAEAADHAAKADCRGFTASQISWSYARVKDGSMKGSMVAMDDEIHAYHKKSGLACMGYSAQAGGFFGGKYDPVSPTPGTEPNPNIVRLYSHDANFRRLAEAKAIAAKLSTGDCEVTANHVALAYLYHQSFPGFAIAGPGNLEQTIDSCKAGTIELSAEQCERLAAAGG